MSNRFGRIVHRKSLVALTFIISPRLAYRPGSVEWYDDALLCTHYRA